ncbi:MAG: class I SAM-dependent methyltransferase [Oligoflexia bacterium]|nr:class I SAM-dependent methyltransferase [Oligoflexia bacterium]
MNKSVGVVCSDLEKIKEAKSLALKYELPFLDSKVLEFNDSKPELILHFSKTKIELIENIPNASGPVFVDFTDSTLNYRRTRGGAQQILKAIGGANQFVLDATAGLGRDSFILTSLGCKVIALEKSVVLYTLLVDGIKRAQDNLEISKIINSNLVVYLADSIDWLTKCPQPVDVIYLDPMFPHKKKSALPKKEMQLLQLLLGSPEDESESLRLLQKARSCAKRVVIKRPAQASELEKDVTVSFKGESTRFDVYVQN